jgi:hypothetical protein
MRYHCCTGQFPPNVRPHRQSRQATIFRLAALFLRVVTYVNRRAQRYWPFAATGTGMGRRMAPLEGNLPKAIDNGAAGVGERLAAA